MKDVIEKARLLTEKYIIESKVLEKELIRIDVNDPSGFSFSLSVEGPVFILVFGGWHQPFNRQEEALLVFEKCLSGEARLRVFTSLNILCKGVLEIYNGSAEKLENQYVMALITALLLFHFQKRKRFIEILSREQIDQIL